MKSLSSFFRAAPPRRLADAPPGLQAWCRRARLGHHIPVFIASALAVALAASASDLEEALAALAGLGALLVLPALGLARWLDRAMEREFLAGDCVEAERVGHEERERRGRHGPVRIEVVTLAAGAERWEIAYPAGTLPMELGPGALVVGVRSRRGAWFAVGEELGAASRVAG